MTFNWPARSRFQATDTQRGSPAVDLTKPSAMCGSIRNASDRNPPALFIVFRNAPRWDERARAVCDDLIGGPKSW